MEITPIFTTISKEMESLSKTFITDVMQNIITNISPIVSVGLLLYFMILGIAVMMQRTEQPLQELIWQFFIKGLIVSVAFAGGLYQDKIADVIINFPDDLAKIAFSNADDTLSVADKMLSVGINKSVEIFSSTSFLEPAASIGKVIIALIIGLSTIFLGGIGGGLLLVIKLSCIIFASIGSLFVCCLLFKPTQQLFYKWLDQIIGYGIFGLILTIMFLFLLKLCTRYLDAIHDGDNIYFATLVFLLLAIVSIFMFFFAKDMALSLSGMTSAGIAGVIADKARKGMEQKARKGAIKAGKAATQSAGNIASKIANNVRRRDY